MINLKGLNPEEDDFEELIENTIKAPTIEVDNISRRGRCTSVSCLIF